MIGGLFGVTVVETVSIRAVRIVHLDRSRELVRPGSPVTKTRIAVSGTRAQIRPISLAGETAAT
jgi:hypothetical protein